MSSTQTVLESESEKKVESGNVVVTLLNLSSVIENEVLAKLSEKKWDIFGAKNVTHNHLEKDNADTYTFGPLTIPGLLGDSLFAWIMFIRSSEDGVDNYMLCLNVNNKEGGAMYCDFESVVTKELLDSVKQLYSLYAEEHGNAK